MSATETALGEEEGIAGGRGGHDRQQVQEQQHPLSQRCGLASPHAVETCHGHRCVEATTQQCRPSFRRHRRSLAPPYYHTPRKKKKKELVPYRQALCHYCCCCRCNIAAER